MSKEKTVWVSLYLADREQSYGEYTYPEAKELLTKKMNPGFSYRISPWQFDEPGVPYSCDWTELRRVEKEILG